MKPKVIIITVCILIVATGILILWIAHRRRDGMTNRSYRTRYDINQLLIAIETFRHKYNYWPPFAETNNLELVSVLSGSNTHKLVFIELIKLEKDKGFMDAWGNSYHFMILDKTNIMLWSDGPNGVDEKCRGDDISITKDIQP